jgi:hypothetical protein
MRLFVQAIIIEIVAKNWQVWCAAKIMAGTYNVAVIVELRVLANVTCIGLSSRSRDGNDSIRFDGLHCRNRVSRVSTFE